MKAKKVIIANSNYYPSKGGVENSIWFMSRELLKNNVQLRIFAGQNSYKYEENLNDSLVYNFFLSKNYIVRVFSAIKRIRSLDSCFDSDLIVSRNYFTTFIAIIATNKPVYYILPAVYKNQYSPSAVNNHSLSYKLVYFVNNHLEQYAINNSDKIFVFSESMRKQVCEINKNIKVNKCYPGIDVNKFNIPSREDVVCIREKYSIPLDKKIILCLGRVINIKGFQYAVDAVEMLDENYHLLVVGEGPKLNELKETSASKKIQNRVSFFDFTSNPEDFYKASDIFMFTSEYEPFGQVLLEAVACGLRVVSFSNQINNIDTAVDEVYQDTKCINYNALEHTAKALSIAIKKVDFTCEEAFLSERSKVINRFSWSKMVSEVFNI